MKKNFAHTATLALAALAALAALSAPALAAASARLLGAFHTAKPVRQAKVYDPALRAPQVGRAVFQASASRRH